MNRTAIANYAPAARRDFIDAVSERAAAFALTASSHDPVGKDGAFAVVNGVSLTAAQAEARNVLNMCNLSEGFYELGVEKGMEQGIEKGRMETLLDALRNIVDGLHLTLGNAMDVLHVAGELRPGIRKALA